MAATRRSRGVATAPSRAVRPTAAGRPPSRRTPRRRPSSTRAPRRRGFAARSLVGKSRPSSSGRAPIARIQHGPAPAPTKTCGLPGATCTKSHARSGRSSPSSSSRHSPPRTRKSSCAASEWYFAFGWPGRSTWMFTPMLREHRLGRLEQDPEPGDGRSNAGASATLRTRSRSMRQEPTGCQAVLSSVRASSRAERAARRPDRRAVRGARDGLTTRPRARRSPPPGPGQPVASTIALTSRWPPHSGVSSSSIRPHGG